MQKDNREREALYRYILNFNYKERNNRRKKNRKENNQKEKQATTPIDTHYL